MVFSFRGEILYKDLKRGARFKSSTAGGGEKREEKRVKKALTEKWAEIMERKDGEQRMGGWRGRTKRTNAEKEGREGTMTKHGD